MTTKPLTKSMGGSKLLDVNDTTGVVTVAFAQLEVVDHDGDYTVRGAFQVGQKVKVCQTGHAHYKPVVGTGVILGEKEMPDGSVWAVAELTYFLQTKTGEEHFRIIKAVYDAGHTQEWSYGYDILDAEQTMVDGKRAQALKSLSVYEISDVLRGAGIGTHTLGVKAADGACETCGQSIPKAVTDDDETGDEHAEDDVKGRADCLALQWSALKQQRQTARHTTPRSTR